MAACEKCWAEARRRSLLFSYNSNKEDISEIYHKILKEVEDSGQVCSLEDQCGELHVVLKWHAGPDRCRCGKVISTRRTK